MDEVVVGRQESLDWVVAGVKSDRPAAGDDEQKYSSKNSTKFIQQTSKKVHAPHILATVKMCKLEITKCMPGSNCGN